MEPVGDGGGGEGDGGGGDGGGGGEGRGGGVDGGGVRGGGGGICGAHARRTLCPTEALVAPLRLKTR